MKRPILIKHRVNRIAQLSEVATEWGVEIDLRSSVRDPGHIHLSHDPWTLGDSLDAWLKAFVSQGISGPIILNTKEDGLESRALELLASHGLGSYFFLDTTLPSLVTWALRGGNPHFALRISKHEPLDGAQSFKGRVEWVWIDCFDGDPVAETIAESLRADFKICLVSPELQGISCDAIHRFGRLFTMCDAVCTREPQRWIDLERVAPRPLTPIE